MNVNFCGKISWLLHFFMFTAAPIRTIHVVAPPTILTRGVGLEVCKCEEKKVLCQRLSIRLDALHRRDTYGRLLTFVIRLPPWRERTCTRTFMYVFIFRQCATQHVATPTITLNFRDQQSNHEIHENIVPQKFGAIRYTSSPHPSACNDSARYTCTYRCDKHWILRVTRGTTQH